MHFHCRNPKENTKFYAELKGCFKQGALTTTTTEEWKTTPMPITSITTVPYIATSEKVQTTQVAEQHTDEDTTTQRETTDKGTKPTPATVTRTEPVHYKSTTTTIPTKHICTIDEMNDVRLNPYKNQ